MRSRQKWPTYPATSCQISSALELNGLFWRSWKTNCVVKCHPQACHQLHGSWYILRKSRKGFWVLSSVKVESAEVWCFVSVEPQRREKMKSALFLKQRPGAQTQPMPRMGELLFPPALQQRPGEHLYRTWSREKLQRGLIFTVVFFLVYLLPASSVSNHHTSTCTLSLVLHSSLSKQEKVAATAQLFGCLFRCPSWKLTWRAP